MSKYCKCGRELPQKSKEDSCEYCQNKKNKKTRSFLESALIVASAVFSVGLMVITKGKFGGSKT